MDSISALREQLESAHWLLEATMDGVTAATFQWKPTGSAESIADNYLHTVVGEDQTVHTMLQTQTPLFSGDWAGKTGLSSVPGGVHGSTEWSAWVKSVEVDLSTFRAYAKAVYAATAAYLASLKPEDLDRPVDLTGFGLGVQSTNWTIFNFVIGHAANHTGEISAIKGCQDLTGYPF
jgi:hypothetical protein